ARTASAHEPSSGDATAEPVVFLEAFEPEPQSSNIGVNGFFSVDPAQQGSTFQAAVVMDIPGGLHVNSNRPGQKFIIPTVVKVSAPRGFRVTPVTYPRAASRSFRFSDQPLSVYEGRAVFRFNVSVPANHPLGVETVRVNVRFQSCNEEACFPPASRDLGLRIAVVDRNTPSNRVNTNLFGGGRRRR
ncbi:MAG TPA: protein-disulfide reductase DsbD domain-containing protein, partial [Pyrinomonadaceae bacterium]